MSGLTLRDALTLLTVVTGVSLGACADLNPPPEQLAGGSAAVAGGASTGGAGQAATGGFSGGSSSAGAASPGGSPATQGGSGSSATTGGSAGGEAPSPAGGEASGGAAGDSSGGQSSTAGSAAGGSMNGSGGAGGAASCQSKLNGEVRAWLFHEIAATISNELHPFVALTTTGSDIPLSELAIRYYFTGEMSGEWQVDCIWVTQVAGSGSGLCDAGTSIKVVSLDPPRSQADHYLEVAFPEVSQATLSSVPTPVFEARSSFWRTGRPMMNQANDYSFAPTTSEVLSVEDRAYKQTSRVTVYRKGALIWGEEPCP